MAVELTAIGLHADPLALYACARAVSTWFFTEMTTLDFGASDESIASFSHSRPIRVSSFVCAAGTLLSTVILERAAKIPYILHMTGWYGYHKLLYPK